MAEKVFTFEEVAEHNKKHDCWLIVSGKVYDVTRFLDDHPGGDEVLLRSTGKDATADFEDVGHSDDAISQREKYLIGSIDESTLPADNQYTDSYTANRETSGSSKLLPYLLPILIIGVALLLHFYSKKNEEA